MPCKQRHSIIVAFKSITLAVYNTELLYTQSKYLKFKLKSTNFISEKLYCLMQMFYVKAAIRKYMLYNFRSLYLYTHIHISYMQRIFYMYISTPPTRSAKPSVLPVFEQYTEGHLIQSQIIWQQVWPIPVPFCDGWLLINEKTLLLVINQS